MVRQVFMAFLLVTCFDCSAATDCSGEEPRDHRIEEAFEAATKLAWSKDEKNAFVQHELIFNAVDKFKLLTGEERKMLSGRFRPLIHAERIAREKCSWSLNASDIEEGLAVLPLIMRTVGRWYTPAYEYLESEPKTRYNEVQMLLTAVNQGKSCAHIQDRYKWLIFSRSVPPALCA